MEIIWQEGRLDGEYSKSHPEAELLEEADFHPEVDLHPEVNVLALADSLDMRKLKSISQRVQEPDCTMIRNVNYFSQVFGAELIKAKSAFSLKVLGEHLSK